MFSNKRASGILWEHIGYISFSTIFFLLLFVYVANAGSDYHNYEKVYAKKIALLIDMANPGDKIVLDVSDMAAIAINQKLDVRNMLNIANGEVYVKFAARGGYSQKYFTISQVSAKLEQQGSSYILSLEIKNA